MENQSKYLPAGQFLVASFFLFLSLLSFKSALTSTGLEDKVLVADWGFPFVILLIILFDLGWWFENVIESLLVSEKRKGVVAATQGFILGLLLIGVMSPLLLLPAFFQFGIRASAFVLLSGFFIRVSVMQPAVRTKLRMRT